LTTAPLPDFFLGVEKKDDKGGTRYMLVLSLDQENVKKLSRLINESSIKGQVKVKNGHGIFETAKIYYLRK